MIVGVPYGKFCVGGFADHMNIGSIRQLCIQISLEGAANSFNLTVYNQISVNKAIVKNNVVTVVFSPCNSSIA